MKTIQFPPTGGAGGGFTIKSDRYFADLAERDAYPTGDLKESDMCAVGFDPATRQFFQWQSGVWTEVTPVLQGRRGAQGEKGDVGSKVVAASFEGDDIRFLLDDSSTFNLPNAKIELKGEKGDTGTPADIEEQLAGKVDKVVGKGLSSNDFTDALKSFVENTQTGSIQNTQDFTFDQVGSALQIRKNGVVLGKITPDGSWFAEAVGTGVGSFHLGEAHTMTSAGNNVGFINEYGAASAAERSLYVPVWQSLRLDGVEATVPKFLHFSPLVPAVITNGEASSTVVDYNYSLIGNSDSVTYAVTVKAAETYSGVIVSSILDGNSGIEIYRSKQDFDCTSGNEATVVTRTPFFVRTGDSLQMRFLKEDGSFLQVYAGADETRPWTSLRLRSFVEREVQWFDNSEVLAATTAVYTTEKDNKLNNLDNRFRGIFANLAEAIAATPSPQSGFYFQNLETNTIWQYTTVWADTGVASNGDMTAATYDPTGVAADAFNRANHTGDVPLTNVAGLTTSLAEKQNVITGAATSVVTNNLTASRVVVTDVSGKLTNSAVTTSQLDGFPNAIDSKVTAEVGKGLSANDYTDAEKTKLAGVAAGATANATDAQLRDRATHTGVQAINTVDGLSTALAGKVDKEAGKGLSANDYTDAEKTKLAGVAAGATANATNAQLRDRATHTGAQAISTVTGLQTALDGKVNVEAGKGLSTNDFTNAEKTKLGSVASGATANSTDADLRNRTTHTGTQSVSTITGLGTAATRDVTTSATDTTGGRLLKVGDFGLGASPANGQIRSWVLPQFNFGASGVNDEYLILFPSATSEAHGIKGEIHGSRGRHDSANISIVQFINAQSAFGFNDLSSWFKERKRFMRFAILSVDGVDYVALRGDSDNGPAQNQLVFYGSVIGGDSKLFTRVRASDSNVTVIDDNVQEIDQMYHTGNTGTAVTRDVTTSATDTTAGRLMKVGDFGLGLPFNGYRRHIFSLPSLSSQNWHHIIWSSPSGSQRFSGTINIYSDGGENRRNFASITMSARENGGFRTFSIPSIISTESLLYVEVTRQDGIGWTVSVKNDHPTLGIGAITVVYEADCVLHSSVTANTPSPITVFDEKVRDNDRRPYNMGNLAPLQNTSGATVNSNATVAGSGLTPEQTGTWRNVTGVNISNNDFGLFMRV